MKTKIAIRRLGWTIGLALTSLAFATGASAGDSGTNACSARAQDCLTAAEFRALTIRSEALNRKYGLGE